jgi:transposase
MGNYSAAKPGLLLDGGGGTQIHRTKCSVFPNRSCKSLSASFAANRSSSSDCDWDLPERVRAIFARALAPSSLSLRSRILGVIHARPGFRPQPNFFPSAFIRSAHLGRPSTIAGTTRAFPSGALGPVDAPPCIRQRVLPLIAQARQRGCRMRTAPVAPGRGRSPIRHDRVLYRQRHKIENMFARLNDWRRIHTRYDRCAHTFFSAICIAAIVLFWINQ